MLVLGNVVGAFVKLLVNDGVNELVSDMDVVIEIEKVPVIVVVTEIVHELELE